MPLFDITSGVQSPAAAGAVTGTLDTSAMTGDFTVRVRVAALAAGKSAILAVQDTAHASAFSEAVPVAVMHVQGEIQPGAEKVFVFRRGDIPGTRFGATNAKLRVAVLSISPAAGLQVHASLEQ